METCKYCGTSAYVTLQREGAEFHCSGCSGVLKHINGRSVWTQPTCVACDATVACEGDMCRACCMADDTVCEPDTENRAFLAESTLNDLALSTDAHFNDRMGDPHVAWCRAMWQQVDTFVFACAGYRFDD